MITSVIRNGLRISGKPPPLPLVLGEATHTVGLWSGCDKATCRPSIAKHEYEHTPPELAQWLVDLAERCKRHNA